MVGTLVAYARGKITKRDIYEMLTIPSKHHFAELGVSAAPGCGLYLANIEFSENAMQLHRCDEQTHGEEKTKAVACG